MMLIVETQVFENYGWKADGTIGIGTEAFWKAKGGSTYKVRNVPTGADLRALAEKVAPSTWDDYYQEDLVGYGLVEDGYLSQFERHQLEYEGCITHPEPSFEYTELM